MADHDGIRIDLDDILRQLDANGHDDVRVEFVPEEHRGVSLFEAMTGAAYAADTEVPSMWGESAMATVAGGTVKLKSPSSLEDLIAWLSAFASDLRVGGLRGTLHATPTVRLPNWITELAVPRATGYVAFDTPSGDEIASPDGTQDASPLAEWCDRAVAWASEDGGDAYLSSRGMSQRAPAGGISSHLYLSLQSNHSARITYSDSRSGRIAQVGLDRDGQAVYQAYDAVSVAAQVGRVRDAFIAAAGSVRLAFIAMTPVRENGWTSRGEASPALPTISASSLRADMGRWHRFVPDAHGIQLLTEKHMSRVSDVSAWTVTEVVPGRYLVEARDPADWFGTGGPSESVVARARADFGPAIVPADAET